jgi:diguanylate cyclase (GGDEF)-like protein
MMTVKQWAGKQFWQFAIMIAALLLTFFMIAKVTSVASNKAPDMTLASQFVYIEDKQNELNIEKVVTLDEKSWATLLNRDELSWGMHHDALWLKATLPQLDRLSEWLLEIDNILIDELEVWFLYDGSRLDYYLAGDDIPLDDRQSEHAKFIFPIPEPSSGSAIELIIRARTNGALDLPVHVWKEPDYWVFQGEHNLVVGLFLGLLIAIGLSNLLFFITTGSSSFLFYFSYVISIVLTLATLYGVGYEYFWTSSSLLQMNGVAIFSNLSGLFAVLFGRATFDVDRVNSSLDKVLKAFALAFLSMSVLSFFLVYSTSIRIFIVVLALLVVFSIFLGIWVWFKGQTLTRVYVSAWLLVLISGLVISLSGFDVFDISSSYRYSPLFIIFIEALTFAIILAFEHRRKQAALQQTLSEAQDDLAYKVEERTLELQIALRELSETNNELEKKNALDSLTGIKNRSYFDKKYVAEVRRSRREQSALSVAMVDIDYFKRINDNYGHLIGDVCIQHTATLLQSLLRRPSDQVCRYGGEEFAVILPNTDREGAIKLLEDIRKALESSTVEADGHQVKMTLSGGIATSESPLSGNESTLLALADKALYEAKQRGRNRVVHHYLSEES